jgi:hypothetical protein
MSTTLKTRNGFEVEVNGRTLVGYQGETDGVDTDQFELSVDGDAHYNPFTLQTADSILAWEAANDNPTAFEYFFLWADQDVWVQLISASGSVYHTVRAKQGFSLPEGTMLPGTSTTANDGSSAPSVEAILKINVINRSGNEAHVLAVVVN